MRVVQKSQKTMMRYKFSFNNLKYTIVHELLEKSPELDVNFNIYKNILQTIRHNNFKRFENIVKKNLAKKEKVTRKCLQL